jgi:DnaJ domain
MAQKRSYKILGNNPYAVLGITPETTEGEAKLCFRRLAMKYHPDRNSGDDKAAAKFKEASEAWEELQDKLPKSAVPFPDIDPDDPGFDDAIAQWMLDMDAATARPPEAEEAAATPQPSKQAWSTVASEAPGNAMTTGTAAARFKDWRTLAMTLGKESLGLERINPQEAAILLGFHNAFAALKIVQQNSPELCLYDAIVSCAQKSSSTALVIMGADAVDSSACTRALKNPMASIDAAKQNFAVLAQHVKHAGISVNPQKLEVDLAFLEDYIKTQLAPRLVKRRSKESKESKETQIVRY